MRIVLELWGPMGFKEAIPSILFYAACFCQICIYLIMRVCCIYSGLSYSQNSMGDDAKEFKTWHVHSSFILCVWFRLGGSHRQSRSDILCGPREQNHNLAASHCSCSPTNTAEVQFYTADGAAEPQVRCTLITDSASNCINKVEKSFCCFSWWTY